MPPVSHCEHCPTLSLLSCRDSMSSGGVFLEALLRRDDAPFQGLRSTGSMCSSLQASSTDSNLQLTAKIGFITLRLLFSLTRVSAVCPVLLALFSELRLSYSCSTTLTEELGCSARPQLLFTIVPLLLCFWGMGQIIYPEAEEMRSQNHKPKPEDCLTTD